MFTVHKFTTLFSVEMAVRIFKDRLQLRRLNYYVENEKSKRTSLNRNGAGETGPKYGERSALGYNAKSFLVKETHCNAKFPRYVHLFGPRKLHSAYADPFTQLNPLTGPSRIA